MTKLLTERVAFLMSSVEKEALKLISKFEDSESSLLRRLIKEEAVKQNVWVEAQKISSYQPIPLVLPLND